MDAARLDQWKKKEPQFSDVLGMRPITWFNPLMGIGAEPLPIDRTDVEQAAKLWERFAPFLAKAFSETAAGNGVIESPLQQVESLKTELNRRYEKEVKGDLWLKCDHELPIAGSVKARGGVFEVLKLAEDLAKGAGLLNEKTSYEVLTNHSFREFFSQHTIGVGSTGNLGLSIGMIGSVLGFRTEVYMSADAKEWKKELLRQKGVSVIEFSGDFSKAVAAGRKRTAEQPNAYFVDDEKSRQLFLGYSVAALRLEKQLMDKEIQVDANHPLFVYLPCGVGGAPAGITFGLKQVFGDNVHCFFAEPTHAPAMLLGLMTGEMDRISVQDFGLDNRTEADGLAVGRPSSFASPISRQLASGIYTIEDDELLRLLTILADTEEIEVEPSAAAGLAGPWRLTGTDYAAQQGLKMDRVTHIAWATGGALVPKEDRKRFYLKGKELL